MHFAGLDDDALALVLQHCVSGAPPTVASRREAMWSYAAPLLIAGCSRALRARVRGPAVERAICDVVGYGAQLPPRYADFFNLFVLLSPVYGGDFGMRRLDDAMARAPELVGEVLNLLPAFRPARVPEGPTTDRFSADLLTHMFARGLVECKPLVLALFRHQSPERGASYAAGVWWRWRDDVDVALAAVRACGPAVLAQLGPALRGRRDVILAACEAPLAVGVAAQSVLLLAAAEHRADHGVVLAAVSRLGTDLRFASAALCADREVVSAALAQDANRSYRFASAALREDASLVIAAARRWGYHGAALHDALRSHREVALSVVQNDEHALRRFSERICADYGVALAATRAFPAAIRYVAPGLIEQRIVAAGEDLAQDPLFRVAALALHAAPEALRSNKELVLLAVRHRGCALREAAEPLRADREVVSAAIEENGLAIRYASDALRADPELARAAIIGNPASFHSLCGDIAGDCAFTRRMLAESPALAWLLQTPCAPADEPAAPSRSLVFASPSWEHEASE